MKLIPYKLMVWLSCTRVCGGQSWALELGLNLFRKYLGSFRLKASLPANVAIFTVRSFSFLSFRKSLSCLSFFPIKWSHSE